MSHRGSKALSEDRWRKAQYQLGRQDGESCRPAKYADAHYQRGFRRGYRLFEMLRPELAVQNIMVELHTQIDKLDMKIDRISFEKDNLLAIQRTVGLLKRPKSWREVSKVKLVLNRYYITRKIYNRKQKYGSPALMQWTKKGWSTIVGDIDDSPFVTFEIAL